MKTLIGAIALAATLPFATWAQEGWKPSGNIELVVGSSPGGAIDRTARLVAQMIQDSGEIGESTITVVNKPGAGQAAALAYVAQHADDPNYLIMMSPSVINSAVATGGAKPYLDISPIVKVIDGPLIFFTYTDSPIASVEDLAERTKADVASVSWGFSTSAGNTTHVAIAQFAKLLGGDPTKLRIVVSPSGSEVATQVAGGHVEVGNSSIGSAKALLDAGKLRILGIAAETRVSNFPDVPTFRELGYDVIAPSWYAFAGSKGMTPEQVTFYEELIVKLIQSDEAKETIQANDWSIGIVGSKDMPAFLDAGWDEQKAALTELGLIK